MLGEPVTFVEIFWLPLLEAGIAQCAFEHPSSFPYILASKLKQEIWHLLVAIGALFSAGPASVKATCPS